MTIIAGPCVLETLEQALQIGRTVHELCTRQGMPYVFKASFDKANRSSIRSPRGPGIETGLKWLATVKAELEADPNAFFAVGIDTGTALVHFLVEEAVRTSMATPAMQNNHPNRSPLDVFQDDYGTMTEMIKSTITRKLFQLPCHVVIICHSTRRENEDGLIRVGPAMPPAAGQALFTYSDWVLQMTREEKGKNNESVRFIRAAPKGQIEAKDRYNVLQPVEENKHLLELIEFWEESQ